MKLLRVLLFPLMPLYYLATWVRNKCFDLGITRSFSYDTPVVCVGNLSTGGTGKTPMVEYLIRLLQSECRVAVLSRGYGRHTKGFVLASESKSHLDLGDEPLQYYLKYKSITVAVDEKRAHGIETLLKMMPPPEIIVLDDALQHRHVNAHLNILLTSYQNPFYEDFILPTGNLREPRSGYKRAGIIVVTKCPNTITNLEKTAIINKIKPVNGQSVFFSSIQYSEYAIDDKGNSYLLKSIGPFTLVTGIANPDPLVHYLQENNLYFDHVKYSDHHDFSPKNIEELSSKKVILTTEKDFVRLKITTLCQTSAVYYLPIEFALDNQEGFNTQIKKLLVD